MKKLILMICTLFGSFGLKATPLDVYLDYWVSLPKSLAKAEAVLRRQIIELDKMAEARGPEAKLNSMQVGKLIEEMGNFQDAAKTIRSALAELKTDFFEASPHSGVSDKASSISVIFGGMGGGPVQILTKRPPLNEILGQLRSMYFSVVDTTGNTILQINDAISLNTPTQSQLGRVRTLLGALGNVFDRGSKNIFNTKPTAIGDRTISYVAHSTMGFVDEEGPSNLSAKKANQAEQDILRELREAINALKKSEVPVIQNASLFKKVNAGCSHTLTDSED